MLSYEIKKYIIDNDKIIYLLEKIGCHKIKDFGEEYRCALPNKSNNTNVCIKKDNLYTMIYSENIKGDILTLISFIYNLNFIDSLKKAHKLLEISYNYNKNINDERVDPLKIFKKARKKKVYAHELDEEMSKDVLLKYINLPHYSWIKDGILPSICRKFNIGYDSETSRITIAWRGLDIDEETFVGVVGRTTIPNYDELGIPKYFTLKKFKKSNYLYGYAENYNDILSNNYVVVGESEKSVLKRCSRNDNTWVAVGCHDISDRQRQLLISLGVDIIISMDSDISLEKVYELCDKFYMVRKNNIYFIYDYDNKMPSKSSIADLLDKDYWKMFNKKKKYTLKNHNEYMLMLENKKNKGK